MSKPYRVEYHRWYKDRNQEWDFSEEVDYFYAESAEAACTSVKELYRSVSEAVATEITREEYDAAMRREMEYADD